MTRFITALLCLLAWLGPLSMDAFGASQAAAATAGGREMKDQAAAQSADPASAGNPSGHQPPAPARDLTPVFNSEREEPRAEQPSLMASVARTFGALLVVLSLVGAAAWALKRYGQRRAKAPGREALSVMTSLTLADKRTLSVVRFGAQALLIGSTPTSMTLLAQTALSEIETAEAATSALTATPAFARQLNQVYAELEASEGAPHRPSETAERIHHSFSGRGQQ